MSPVIAGLVVVSAFPISVGGTYYFNTSREEAEDQGQDKAKGRSPEDDLRYISLILGGRGGFPQGPVGWNLHPLHWGGSLARTARKYSEEVFTMLASCYLSRWDR